MNSDQIVKTITKEGYSMTANPYEAIYILTDGRMISGDFYSGVRGTDHRMIETVVDHLNRYDKGFWDYVHLTLGLVRFVPETETALIRAGQTLTPAQKEAIAGLNYTIETY